MSLPVKAICYYFSSQDHDAKWRNEDYNTYKMVKAVKGEPIKGYVDLKVGGKIHRFTQENVGKLVTAITNSLGKLIEDTGVKAPILVPVPNSIGTRAVDEFPTHRLAAKIAARLGGAAEARPVLRWQRQQERAHDGGTRNPHVLFSELILVGDVDKGRPHILVDDVCTTGGHFTASAAKLTEAGASVVLGVAVGRTTDQQHTPNILPLDFEVSGPETLLLPRRW